MKSHDELGYPLNPRTGSVCQVINEFTYERLSEERQRDYQWDVTVQRYILHQALTGTEGRDDA